MLTCAGTRYFSSAVSVVFLLSFWSSGSLHHRRVWVSSWTTPVADGISTVYAKNSTLVSWSPPFVRRGYSTILLMNNGTNLVLDELLSSLFSSIGGIVITALLVAAQFIAVFLFIQDKAGSLICDKNISNEEFILSKLQCLS